MTPQEDGTIELTQTGLIDRIIMVMGLDDANFAQTPAEHGGLEEERRKMAWNARKNANIATTLE
jgi:hypothetical protein